MFNLGIDDLAEKTYIPQKDITSMNLLQISCLNIGILIFDFHGGC